MWRGGRGGNAVPRGAGAAAGATRGGRKPRQHFADALVTLRRRFGQRAAEHRLQRWRDVRRGRRKAAPAPRSGWRAAGPRGWRPETAGCRRASATPPRRRKRCRRVASRLLATRLLRRHVGEGAHQSAPNRLRVRVAESVASGMGKCRQAKVQDLDAVVGAHQDIGRLQIAMDDADGMGGRHGLADLPRQRPARGPAETHAPESVCGAACPPRTPSRCNPGRLPERTS